MNTLVLQPNSSQYTDGSAIRTGQICAYLTGEFRPGTDHFTNIVAAAVKFLNPLEISDEKEFKLICKENRLICLQMVEGNIVAAAVHRAFFDKVVEENTVFAYHNVGQSANHYSIVNKKIQITCLEDTNYHNLLKLISFPSEKVSSKSLNSSKPVVVKNSENKSRSCFSLTNLFKKSR